jgi:hypothetical protein
MMILIYSLLIFAGAAVLAFLLIKYGPPMEDRRPKPCLHESVEQWWYDRGIRQRKCVSCGKNELSRNNTPSGYIKLWNPKFINDNPIKGIELEKMLYHKEWLEKKKNAG